MTGLDARFETSKYFLPIWRQKFKMVEKVQNIKKYGYNSKTIKQNVLFNSCVKSISIELKIKFKKSLENIIFCNNMAAKIQNGRKD